MQRWVQQALRQNAFVAWLLAVIALAALFPQLGMRGGWLRSELLTPLGVWLIFFLQGLTLPTGQLARGLQPLRLHGFTLSWNYLWFPLLVLVLVKLAGAGGLPGALQAGFLFLSILPTTISSAISFTVASGGSSPQAIFSSVSSNLLAVVLVPLWTSLLVVSGGEVSIPLGPTLLKLSWLIVLPVFIGQGTRHLWRAGADKAGAWARPASQGIILFIVHAAFATSVASGFWERQSPALLFPLLLGALGLLGLVGVLVWWSSGWLELRPEHRPAAYFCASQKSLATGLPLAASIFAGVGQGVDFSLLLLPLLCYHPAQLIFAAWLSGRFRRAQA